ncbi:MAG: thioredoxin family protein [Myxococcales bacterium]|nr:thioredoxin family protein [Myxococcales bacterium]
MALTQSNGMPLGTAAPRFSLPATDGRSYALDDFANSPVLVVVFTCNHCPYARAIEDRLIAFQQEFGERGVVVVAISSNDDQAYPADSFDAMRVRAKDKGFNFPYLFDGSQEVARSYDAACTPDIFVFDRERKLTYNGRFDDNWQDATRVTQRDLARAVECTLAGKPLDFEARPSMGCNIKWKA